jgi:hypothetical protein
VSCKYKKEIIKNPSGLTLTLALKLQRRSMGTSLPAAGRLYIKEFRDSLFFVEVVYFEDKK